MQEDDFRFPLGNYSKPSQFIEGIKLTEREIDIIACLLQGRTQKTIASFLSIAPRTVETHIRNILLKLEKNSREGIIDFIENAGKLSVLRRRYQYLLIQAQFDKHLQSIAALIKDKGFECYLIHIKDQTDRSLFLKILEEHFNRIGIKIFIEEIEDNIHIIGSILCKKSLQKETITYLSPADFIISLVNCHKEKGNTKTLENLIFLLWEHRDCSDIFLNAENAIYLNFWENYYFAFFDLLRIVCREPLLENVISSFKQKYERLYKDIFEEEVVRKELVENKDQMSNQNDEKTINRLFIKAKNSLWTKGNLTIITLLTLIFLGINAIFLKDIKRVEPEKDPVKFSNDSYKSQKVYSNLILPHEEILLNRPEILKQMEEKLKGEDDIQTLALIGIGGAGKTTLARHYARLKASSVSMVWELNAETKETLIESFESLAYVLCRDEQEKKLLRGIQEIKNRREREQEIIFLVRERLKQHPNWLLIYDNVEAFADIQKYFPTDFLVWGKGRVIITTRNANIKSNCYIGNTLHIGELSSLEKSQLFTRIIDKENTQNSLKSQRKSIEGFLRELPSFPLDVVVAASYLKIANTSYSQYIENLKKSDKEFEEVQREVLNESAQYTKTRYRIITLCLNKIIETHPEFIDLILFLSIIDCANIPRDLMVKFKNSGIVDNFICNLKRYSLITNELVIHSHSYFSIHHSTQEIFYNYLIRNLNINNNTELIEKVCKYLISYIENIIYNEKISKNKEEFYILKNLMIHCESFTKNINICDNNYIKGLFEGKIGSLYYYLGDYQKSEACLEKALHQLEDSSAIKVTDLSWIKGYLGIVYKNLGKYKDAKKILHHALSLYNTDKTNNQADKAFFLRFLGDTYRSLGDYKKAKNYLQESYNLYKEGFPQNYVGIARTLTYLAVIYCTLGDYEKAREYYEQSLIICEKYLKGSIHHAWVLIHYSEIHLGTRNYKKAKELLEAGLEVIYSYSECHIYAGWALARLGSVYLAEGNIQQSKDLFEQGYNIYKKSYNKNHIEVAWILSNWGQAYLREGNLETAELKMQEALLIYQQHGHPEIYIVFEHLAELFLEKSKKEINKKNKKDAEKYKYIALDYLNQAKKIIQKSFSSHFYHPQRIQYKLEDFTK